MNEPICEAFSVLVELMLAFGVVSLNKHEGCWELRVDDSWEISMNGHELSVMCSHGVTVPPFHCYVQYNGFPAGSIHPFGGTIAAGECANEDAFIEAMRKASRARTLQ